jgi:hypothetical protein
MHARRLQVLPQKEQERPAPEFIDWHNEYVCALNTGRPYLPRDPKRLKRPGVISR